MIAVTTQSSVFRYSRLARATVDLPLLPAAFFIAAGYKTVQEGQSVGFGVAFCGFAVALFTMLWYANHASLTTLTVDDQGLRLEAFWGLSQRSLAWPEVERVEYNTIVDRQHGYTGPKTYWFTRRNQPKRFGAKPRYISFSEKIVGYETLLAIVERKSAEYGFSIEPMP